MPTPVDFMRQYRALRVNAGAEDSAAEAVCRAVTYQIQLGTYFMMDWTDGTDQRQDFNLVTRRAGGAGAQAANQWYAQNRERIKSAAMGKGAPDDYELALEWAVRSGRIANPSQAAIQQFCNERLGIDCSGFVTNYLCAAGRRAYSADLVRNTGAASYYSPAHAVNDPTTVRQGDLLVWMDGTRVKTSPAGHIAVVQAYHAVSRAGGNMHVVEATGNARANPKLLDSWYDVEAIFDRGSGNPRSEVMILQVKRHGSSGERVCVIRPA